MDVHWHTDRSRRVVQIPGHLLPSPPIAKGGEFNVLGDIKSLHRDHEPHGAFLQEINQLIGGFARPFVFVCQPGDQAQIPKHTFLKTGPHRAIGTNDSIPLIHRPQLRELLERFPFLSGGEKRPRLHGFYPQFQGALRGAAVFFDPLLHERVATTPIQGGAQRMVNLKGARDDLAISSKCKLR